MLIDILTGIGRYICFILQFLSEIALIVILNYKELIYKSQL